MVSKVCLAPFRNTGRPCLIVLHFTELHRYYIAVFIVSFCLQIKARPSTSKRRKTHFIAIVAILLWSGAEPNIISEVCLYSSQECQKSNSNFVLLFKILSCYQSIKFRLLTRHRGPSWETGPPSHSGLKSSCFPHLCWGSTCGQDLEISLPSKLGW